MLQFAELAIVYHDFFMHAVSRSPITLLLLALVLGLPQLVGFASQFAGGFRPFGTAPGRVTLSWDMFATRIERCGINWNPPLPGGVAELNQKSRVIEWQAVADTRARYERIAAWACAKFHQPGRALLTCFLPSGKEESRVVDCR
jgi:hypothetical protein